MAIKRKTTNGSTSTPSLPARLADLCKRAFTSDAFSKAYAEIAKSTKKDLQSYLEDNDDGFELDLNVTKSFDTEDGKITFATRSKYDYSIDEILKLIDSGAVTIETVLNCVSGFKDKDIKTALGAKFDKVATQTQTEYLTLKANSELKEKASSLVAETFEQKKTEPKKAKPKTKEESVEKSLAKAKAAEKDLDSILDEE